MWRSKKFIVSVALVAVLALTSLGAIAVAADDETNSEGPMAHFSAIWDKVAAILQGKGVTVTADQLRESFAEAREEMYPDGMRGRGALDPENRPLRSQLTTGDMLSRLETMLAEGKITQEQYDNMKSRIESMPEDMPFTRFRGKGFRGMCPPGSGETGISNQSFTGTAY